MIIVIFFSMGSTHVSGKILHSVQNFPNGGMCSGHHPLRQNISMQCLWQIISHFRTMVYICGKNLCGLISMQLLHNSIITKHGCRTELAISTLFLGNIFLQMRRGKEILHSVFSQILQTDIFLFRAFLHGRMLKSALSMSREKLF